MTPTLEALLSQLAALLDLENAALERMDIGAVAALTPEKNRIVDTLRTGMGASGSSGRLDVHNDLLARVSHGSDENKELLERAMRVQRRMLALVASAAQPKSLSYGRRGGPTSEGFSPPRAMIASA